MDRVVTPLFQKPARECPSGQLPKEAIPRIARPPVGLYLGPQPNMPPHVVLALL